MNQNDPLAADFAAFMAQTAAPMQGALDGLARASKGGPGSGNWGHAGRPGEVGGSAAGSGGKPAADPGTGENIPGTATGGKVRQIAGKRANTADIVNAAIAESNQAQLDLGRAADSLRRLGHANPPAETIANYARQTDVLNRIGKATGSNAGGQVGKWNFTNAQTIHDDFLSYLDRRIGGQHARWTAATKR